MSASSDGGSERWRRRAWLFALSLYAAAAAADFAAHLNRDRGAAVSGFGPDKLAVAFSAALFWPVDLVAQGLLAR